jgi:CheY-like chemotaxis protein
MRDDQLSLEFAAILEEADAVSARARAESAPKPNVLIVDDDPAQLRALERVLRGRCVVKTALSASEAIRVLEKRYRFDVILCDMCMPGIDGAVFHAALERLAPEHAARVVFVTGGGLAPHLEAFLRDKRVLRKPWRRDDLLQLLDETIEDDTRLSGERIPISRPTDDLQPQSIVE